MKLVLALVFISGWAQAQNSLVLTDGRIFAQLKGANVTAAYGVFKNDTTKEMILKVDQAPDFKAIELHQTIEKNGEMQMKKMDKAKILPGEVFELKPGGNHIMLFDAKTNPKLNDDVKIVFLVNGKKETYTFKVIPRFPVEPVKKPEHHSH